jgi:hypothetical protein
MCRNAVPEDLSQKDASRNDVLEYLFLGIVYYRIFGHYVFWNLFSLENGTADNFTFSPLPTSDHRVFR